MGTQTGKEEVSGITDDTLVVWHENYEEVHVDKGVRDLRHLKGHSKRQTIEAGEKKILIWNGGSNGGSDTSS